MKDFKIEWVSTTLNSFILALGHGLSSAAVDYLRSC